MTIFWNGNSGFGGGLRGSLGWDEAIVLHIQNWALVYWILVFIVVHSIDTLVYGVEGLKYIITSLLWYKDFVLPYRNTFQTIQLISHWPKLSNFGGNSWHDSGNPFWMYSANIQHFSLVAVAATTLSQVIDLSLGLCAYVDTTDSFMAHCQYAGLCF